MPRRMGPSRVCRQWRVSDADAAADDRLIAAFDSVIREGEQRAAKHIVCRIGCTACCIGPFDITALDAARLCAGVKPLAAEDPAAEGALRWRANEQWSRMSTGFPGDSRSGILSDDEDARQAFFARHADVPCPALDPDTGACVLYRWRPLSCRSFGLPVRYGGQALPACSLNFTLATGDEILAAAVEPDPDDLEGELLAKCGAAETLVCSVLSDWSGP